LLAQSIAAKLRTGFAAKPRQALNELMNEAIEAVKKDWLDLLWLTGNNTAKLKNIITENYIHNAQQLTFS